MAQLAQLARIRLGGGGPRAERPRFVLVLYPTMLAIIGIVLGES